MLLCLIPLLLATAKAGADIALCLIVALFLIHSALSKNWQWAKHPEMLLLGALWCFILLDSWLTPVNPRASFAAALIWGRFILFFAAARYWLLDTPKALKMVNNIGLATLLLVAIHVIWQYTQAFPGQRLVIPFTRNYNVGHYLLKLGLPMLGLLTYRALDSGNVRRLWLPVGGLLLMIALVMLSGERSGALLMFLGITVLGVVLVYSQPQARKTLAYAAIGIVLLMALLSATQVVQERSARLVEQLSDFWQTPYGQLYIDAWRLWQQHPLTGVGVQQFFTACQPGALHTTYCDIHPHNVYAAWLVETGIIGLLLYIAALALMLRDLRKNSAFAGSTGVLSAFAWAGFAVVVWPLIVTQSPFSNWPAIVHWYSLALILSMYRMAHER